MKASASDEDRLLSESEYRKLHGIYTSPSNPAAFGSIKSLVKASGFTRKKVLAYLQSSRTYTKFKPTRKKFQRLPVVALGINHIWSLDVAYMEKISKFNDGYKYLLLAVDVLSRRIRVQPLKDKSSKAAKSAFEKMIDFEKLDFPIKVWVDQGKEFKGEFASFCASNAINVYHTFSETKSCMAERYIRTLKTLLYKFFEEQQTFRYLPQLQKFVKLVNSRYNRSIGMAANDVTQRHVPKLLALQTTKLNARYNHSTKHFQVGDRVRIALKDMPFRKGYKQQYTNEVFKIAGVYRYKQGLVTYKLLDSQNEPILGRFYPAELTHFRYLQNRSRSRHQRIFFEGSPKDF